MSFWERNEELELTLGCLLLHKTAFCINSQNNAAVKVSQTEQHRKKRSLNYIHCFVLLPLDYFEHVAFIHFCRYTFHSIHKYTFSSNERIKMIENEVGKLQQNVAEKENSIHGNLFYMWYIFLCNDNETTIVFSRAQNKLRRN